MTIAALWTFLKSPLGRWIAAWVACLVLLVGIYGIARHNGVRSEKTAVAQKAQAQQAAVQTATVKAVDQVAVKTQAVEERTHVVVKTIHDAPGADDAVPVGVLAGWRDGMRDDADPAG